MATLERSILIDATAAEVFAVVTDLPGMGRFSPENRGGRWRGAGPSLGARFRGKNQNGRNRWSTTVTVSAYHPYEHFEFFVTYLGIPIATWGFHVVDGDDGVTLTEYTTDRRPSWFVKLSGFIEANRSVFNERSIATTLAAMKAYCENDA